MTDSKTRSETVSVRLDPKLKYFADLAARKQRRTLSSYIEYAIEGSLKSVVVQEADGFSAALTVSDIVTDLWDVDDADRFAKLALRFPELLNHTEQVLWKVIREYGYLWRGHYQPDGATREKWTWKTGQADLNFERLRETWTALNRAATGEMARADLPPFPATRPALKPEPPVQREAKPKSSDDDIPF